MDGHEEEDIEENERRRKVIFGYERRVWREEKELRNKEIGKEKKTQGGK